MDALPGGAESLRFARYTDDGIFGGASPARQLFYAMVSLASGLYRDVEAQADAELRRVG
ncbi:hypothetical protein LX32DRAFT_699384, partial [Colletotrichum zoysiae]